MTNLTRCSHWCTSGMDFSLDLSPIPQDETHTWHHYQAVIGTRREPITVTLLNLRHILN